MQPTAGLAQEMKAAYFRLDASGYQEFTTGIKTAESLGAVVRHRFYPHAAMGFIPEGTELRMAAVDPVVQLFVGQVTPNQMIGMSSEEKDLAKAYNKLFFPQGVGQAATQPGAGGAVPDGTSAGPAADGGHVERSSPAASVGAVNERRTGDAADEGPEIIDFEPKIVPREYLDEVKAAVFQVSSAAPIPATSEFMLGHSAVGVIMPESKPGYGGQDWTPAEEAKAVEEVISAMDWWARHSPGRSLRFSYEINYRVPISLEPLDVGGMETEGQWATESLENLGYSASNRFTMAYQYVDDLRARYSSDWGFLVFVLHGTEGQAFGRALAYAYLGGPYNVNAYSNGRLGTEDLDRVIAHETGHTFYTLDEYPSAPITCQVRAGYLYAENANKQEGEPGCKSDVPCVMRGSEQEVPFSILEPCYYTRGQLGWWDKDGDGIPDILDTNPVLESVAVDTAGMGATVSGDTLYSTSVSFKGTAKAVPLPNRNPKSGIPGSGFTVEPVGAEYRVDGGMWTSCHPADGWFDGPLESFGCEVSGLGPWSWHTIEFRAVTAHGNSTPDTLFRSFSWFVVPERQRESVLVLASSNPAKPPVDISFAPVHPSGASGLPVAVEIAVFDPAGRKVAVLESGSFESGVYHTTRWDGADMDGNVAPAGVYLIAMMSEGRSRAQKVLVIP
jgi:hypothetical protein